MYTDYCSKAEREVNTTLHSVRRCALPCVILRGNINPLEQGYCSETEHKINPLDHWGAYQVERFPLAFLLTKKILHL